MAEIVRVYVVNWDHSMGGWCVFFKGVCVSRGYDTMGEALTERRRLIEEAA